MFQRFGAWVVSIQKLQAMGINTVLDLACAEPREMQKKFSIVMVELFMNCKVSHALRLSTLPIKKQIVASRSFGGRVTELTDLKEAISMYAQDACKGYAMKVFYADV